MSAKVLRGVIHGQTIELTGDSGIADGAEIEVVLRPVVVRQNRQPGEGFLRTEGALANDPHWDAIMDDIYRSRKIERRPQMEDL